MLTTIIAGDYYNIPLTFADYPASAGYVCKLALRGPSILTATASAVGDDYNVELLSNTTQALPEGTYEYAISVTKNGQRTTLESGYCKVTGDVSSAGAKVISLEARVRMIECVLDGKINDDVESYSIAGRSVTRIPMEDLMSLRAQAYTELAALTGTMPSRTIKVRFTGTR